MRKAWAFLLAMLLGFGLSAGTLYAQDNDSGEGGTIDSDWEIYAPEFYSRGDQTFIISLGVIFPTVFFNNDGDTIKHNLFTVGGTGSLAYNYFLNSHISLGGEIGGMINYTAAQNVVFIIPIGARLGYQFVFGHLEVPFTLVLGFAPQKYLDYGYLGMFAKAGGSVFYRFNPDWSFGVNINWSWFPQWVKDSSKSVYGNIVDVTVAARYHF
jgi:hypothetical protein